MLLWRLRQPCGAPSETSVVDLKFVAERIEGDDRASNPKTIKESLVC